LRTGSNAHGVPQPSTTKSAMLKKRIPLSLFTTTTRQCKMELTNSCQLTSPHLSSKSPQRYEPATLLSLWPQFPVYPIVRMLDLPWCRLLRKRRTSPCYCLLQGEIRGSHTRESKTVLLLKKILPLHWLDQRKKQIPQRASK
jgi:hypothetical protein